MSAAIELIHAPLPDPIARARVLAPLIEAAAPQVERGGQLTAAVLDALHGAGLFRTLLPRALGGDQLRPADFLRMQEVLAAADASTAWCVGQASGCAMASAYLAPEVAADIWGDPRAVLAWGMGEGTAQVVPNGFHVTGHWRFASGSRHATWIGAHCRVREADGALRTAPDGTPVERTMLLPRDHAEWTRDWRVIGLRGTGSDSYRLTEHFVPDAYAVGRDTDAERRVRAPLYHFSSTPIYAAGFAGVALGTARAMLDAFRALALRKTPAAATRALRDSEVVQSGLAQAEAKLRGARAFLLEVLDAAWDEAQSGPLPTATRFDIRLATTSAIHRAGEVAEWAYREAGAGAIFEDGPFERRLRDIHASGQQIQARADHLEACGKFMLGLPVRARFI